MSPISSSLASISKQFGVFGSSSSGLALRSFSYVEYSSTNTWDITVPADTQPEDLMIVMAGCRDGRNQDNFAFTGTASFTDLASGLQNIFCRYATANSGDAGTIITTTWSGNTTGPIGLYVFKGGTYVSSSIQGRTNSNYTLTAPSGYSPDKIAILFNQDRADNTVSPGLSEILREADVDSGRSYYKFQIERSGAASISNQSVTNVQSDSVGAYIVVGQ